METPFKWVSSHHFHKAPKGAFFVGLFFSFDEEPLRYGRPGSSVVVSGQSDLEPKASPAVNFPTEEVSMAECFYQSGLQFAENAA
ncbi:MAG: hypothetical protein VKN83_03410 [Cyanobacteriota bacterium]|nr:hypothetical protein [Cyanobacteriota bacterium]